MSLPKAIKDLPQDPNGKIPNPIICKSGGLMYWTVGHEPIGNMWMSLIGMTGVLSERSQWAGIGASFNYKDAIIKARERAVWESAYR